MRHVLAQYDFDAIVMLDGRGSLALWLPVTDPHPIVMVSGVRSANAQSNHARAHSRAA